MSNLPREPYRIPQVLRDLQLVDVLGLTGSTTASAALASQLGLQRLTDASMGKRYGHTPWLQLLRRGSRSDAGSSSTGSRCRSWSCSIG